ncbi:hypothetical protein ACJQWK_02844 [Exserohilum turcicum]|uniref:Uncharacterized protein n=1 Tax=Exserohilum turcicum (strain 28A) TaxID=671987 RepID=R0IYE3_EXST2|nr:uncharacterized protein SETTUDRAFT_146580 [Exserohilum turcica Et28A]EOA89566.1 hypothetical protein SETTUDRAFT_146580 [Exserohilum turcica Et28A]
MSSGNPFRASQAFAQPAPGPHASFVNMTADVRVSEARWGDSDHVLDDAATPPPRTKKSVRIVSPTTTIPPPQPDLDDASATLNELQARRASQPPPASPPPPVTPAAFATHPLTAGDANAHVIGKDAMAMADALPATRASFGAPSPRSMPANPFAKTLASLEPHEREAGPDERAHAQRLAAGNNNNNSNTNRASLDVESFKNLLMTGRPTPRASGPSAQPGSAPHSASSAQFESSSSTDASSISRQSISELPQETLADSSRTSDDTAGDDDDEHMGLAVEAKKGKKKPPPAPKPRHGKPVAPRQPQVVSFDDFEATEPAPTPGIRRTDSSDAYKPLPPTPSAHQQQPPTQGASPDFTPPQSRPLSLRLDDVPRPSSEQARPKKAPPPVPLARRQSQLKSTSLESRQRSSSNLTISSQHSVDPPQTPTSISHDPMSSAKSPPPPPPSRYGARLANLANSSANSSSTELALSSSSIRAPRSLPDPPSHRLSMLELDGSSSPASSMHRTSSVSSSRNMARNVSGGSTGSQMPPPPPPRRRQSNRSSLDQPRPLPNSLSSPTESRRTSTEYRRASHEHRRTSITSETSSLHRSYAKPEHEHALYSPADENERILELQVPHAPTTAVNHAASTTDTDSTVVDSNTTATNAIAAAASTNSSSILDDMERFQREIEELRVRYKHVA